MPLVEFTGTPSLKTWRHSDGGKVLRKHGDRYTTMVDAPLVLKTGDRVTMSDVDFAWCRATYPSNFSLVSDDKRESEG